MAALAQDESPDLVVELRPPENLEVMQPELLQPGTHTVALGMGPVLHQPRQKYYTDTCNAGGPSPIYDPTVLEVGWTQVEIDGDPCLAASAQVAVLFDTRPLDRVPAIVINRAVLAYDEVPSRSCYTAPGPDPSCWRSANSEPQDKPEGCVVVRVPTWDWRNVAPPNPIPYSTDPHPTIVRLATREWDVTEPFAWQYTPGAAPLEAVGTYGFLLASGLSLEQLEAEDNSSCLSIVSNIRLLVTYTVFDDEPFREPR
jgi:hypothetical protein